MCAFANSILAHSRAATGMPTRVGLFTSPHLLSVRERIAINSQSLSEPLFARYFFEIWDALRLDRDTPPSVETALSRPNYFRFLTLMAFHAFLAEGVDVAVVEVGVGGAFDSTNIVERPVATGVAALGIDHVEVLGNTLAKIAWQKAGIFKRGAPAYSVPQKPEAEAMLRERAAEKGLGLQTVAPSAAFDDISLLPNESYQRENAALAVALANTALKRLGQASLVPPQGLSAIARQGLERTVWRGRFETLKLWGCTWYLDGAHTEESMKLSGRCFGDMAKPG